MIRRALIAMSFPLLLWACADEPYEEACQAAVLDNRDEYQRQPSSFDYELSRTHYFSNGTAQSVSVFYLELEEGGSPRRVRISCYANTAEEFVYAFVKDEFLGPRVVGPLGQTLPRRPPVNER